MARKSDTYAMRTLSLWAIFGMLSVHGNHVTTIEYTMLEEQRPGTMVGNVKVDSQLEAELDPDVLDQLTFSLLPGDDGGRFVDYFSINAATGMLGLRATIDRDLEGICAFQDDCVGSFGVAVGPAQYFRTFTINVILLDVNDNEPRFTESDFRINISESASPGMRYPLPSASDPDSIEFGISEIHIQPASEYFTVQWTRDFQGKVQPLLELVRAIDREEVSTLELSIVALDGGNSPRSAHLLVHVTIEDANDNPPQFDQPYYQARVDEDASLNTVILTVRAVDPDLGVYGQISYSFAPSTRALYGDTFHIDSRTGDILLISPLDREAQDFYGLIVFARDMEQEQPKEASVNVHIYVNDVNDNPPQIRVNALGNSGRVAVNESAQIGTFVAVVLVTDRDEGRNAEVTCDVDSDVFTLQRLLANRYKVITRSSLDREITEQVDMEIRCRDNGEVSLADSHSLTVYVNDVNDNTPTFVNPEYHARVLENAPPGTPIIQVQAVDRDSGKNGQIVYNLTEDYEQLFTIDHESGIISTNTVLDHEDTQLIQFPVTASDRGDPVVLFSSAVVKVYILDVNDEVPQFNQETYTFVVVENQPAGTELGRLVALDGDSPPYNQIQFKLEPITPRSGDFFHMDQNSGLLKTVQPLDRESQTFYHFTAVAYNNGTSLSGTASVTVYVADENDNPPIIDFPNSTNSSIQISNEFPVGHRITQIRAHDLDAGGNAELSYFLASHRESNHNAFAVDPKSGELVLAKDVSDQDLFSYDVHIVVRDGGVPQRFASANLTVIVNRSLIFLPRFQDLPDDPERSGGATMSNMFLIIIVVAVTSVIIIILLAAIVCVLLRSRRKGVPPPTSGLLVAEHGSMMGSVTAIKGKEADSDDNGNKELAFSPNPVFLDFEKGSLIAKDNYGMEVDSEKNNLSPAPGESRDVTPEKVPDGSIHVCHGSNMQKPRIQGHPHTSAHPQIHHRDPQNAHDIDGESSTSGELSAADSGRGTSEDGERQLHIDLAELSPCSSKDGSQNGLVKAKSPRPCSTPDYGLTSLQTQFDPHYRLKYVDNQGSMPPPLPAKRPNFRCSAHGMNYDRIPELSVMGDNRELRELYPERNQRPVYTIVPAKIRKPRHPSPQTRWAPGKQTEAAHAQDRLAAGLQSTGAKSASHEVLLPADGHFRDSNSLIRYKQKPGRADRASPEMTEGTSSSTTSGSYVVQDDADPRKCDKISNVTTSVC